MKLSDYVIERIAGTGTRHIFLLPGGGAMHLVDSVGRCPDVEFVCNLHEQGAAVAADAYGQYTGRLGVALVTTGPGGTNTVTGVAAAWLDSTPCLFVSGQVKRADSRTGRGVRQMGFQEIDIVEIVRPITKYAATVTEPETIGYHMDKALHLARSGRPGPVWIDVPLDVQAASIDPERLARYTPEPAAGGGSELNLLAEETLRLLGRSSRPVILLGNGVRLAGAVEDFHRLARQLGIPVLVSWKAADMMPREHPLYAGRPGMVGQRGANFTLQNCDFLLSLGSRLDFGQIGFDHASVARRALKVVVDIDPAELGKFGFRVDLPVCAGAREFIAALLGAFDGFPRGSFAEWLEHAQSWRRRYPVVLPDYWKAEDHVDPYVLMEVLGENLAAGDVVVPGSSGAASELTHQALELPAGVRMLNSQGLGPMGFAVPAALGACLASGGRRTIAIDGDGGFHMNSQELETIHRLDLPIKLFVLNNDGYGSIRATQRNHFAGRYVASDPSSGLTLPDLGRIAAAYGWPAFTAFNHKDLRRIVRDVLTGPGPVLCEVMVAKDHPTMPRVASRQRADGSMVSEPLENLWPFLDPAELELNMLSAAVEEAEEKPEAEPVR